jgi:hypothetical protein
MKACTWCGGQDSAIHQCPPEACTYAVPGSFDAELPSDDKLRELMARIAGPFPPPDQVNGYPLVYAQPRHGMTSSRTFDGADPLSDLRAALDRINGELLCGPEVYVFSHGLLGNYRDHLLERGETRLAGEIQAILDDPKARL